MKTLQKCIGNTKIKKILLKIIIIIEQSVFHFKVIIKYIRQLKFIIYELLREALTFSINFN